MSKDFTKGFSTFILLLGVTVALLILDSYGVLLRPRSFITSVLVPTQEVFIKTGKSTGSFFSMFTFWRSGSMKIEYLEQRVRELTVEAEKVVNLEAENKALKEQIGISLTKERKMLLAGVAGSSQNFLIDKGTKDGVKEGMAVIYKDIFLGRAGKVFDNSSLVTLITDPLSKVTAVTSKTRAKGIVVGQFGSGASIEKVLTEDTLSKDDIVLTSGEGGVLKGYLIGKIAEVKKEDEGVFQKATLSLLLKFSDLTHVFVVLE